mgnify:CR=1 FL=1
MTAMNVVTVANLGDSFSVGGQTPGKIEAATVVNGVVELPGDYNFVAMNVWEATGLQVTLPQAGIYLLFADVRGVVIPASSGSVFVFARLFNGTDNAPVPATHRLVIRAEGQAEAVGSIQTVAAFGGAATIRLEARLAGVAGSSGNVYSRANGRTALGYVRIA